MFRSLPASEPANGLEMALANFAHFTASAFESYVNYVIFRAKLRAKIETAERGH